MLLCRAQRCILDNAERCRLLTANDDCLYVSPASLAIRPSLSGCFGYAQRADLQASYRPGYKACCKHFNVEYTAEGLSLNVVYRCLDDKRLTLQIGIPLSNNSFPCSNTFRLDSHALLLAQELCLIGNGQSGTLPSLYAAFLGQFRCRLATTQQIVSGWAGCYIVQTNEKGKCSDGSDDHRHPICYYYVLKNLNIPFCKTPQVDY